MTRTAALVLSLLLLLLPLPAAAQMSRVDLLPGWQTRDGDRMAGVRITLAPGWKTYWRAPGGNGIPPQFDFSGSDNIKAVRIHWPKPELFESWGMTSIGYMGSVTFPLEVTPADRNRPIRLDLALAYGVCEEVCIPAEANAALTLAPDDRGEDGPIRAALEARPLSAAEAGIRSATCAIRPDGDGFRLTAEIAYRTAPTLAPVAVFESGTDLIWIAAESSVAGPKGVTVEARLDYYGDGPLALDRGAITVNLLDPARIVEIRGCPAG